MPWHKVRNDIAAVIPVPEDKRSVFVVPWGDFTYVGTTDTDYDGPVDDPQCTADDVDYLLRALNGAVTTEITEDDIVGTWAGLRPLVAKPAAERPHRRPLPPPQVHRSDAGVVTITGGKLTTYREMAADTVDEVLEHVLDAGAIERVQRHSRTKRLKLHGADGYDEVMAEADRLSPLGGDIVRHLADRYGADARTVLAIAESDPAWPSRSCPASPTCGPRPCSRSATRWPRTVDDVLSRRTRARLLGRDDSAHAAAATAELIGPLLGWDDAEQARQAADYRRPGHRGAGVRRTCPRSPSTRRWAPDGRRGRRAPGRAGPGRSHPTDRARPTPPPPRGASTPPPSPSPTPCSTVCAPPAPPSRSILPSGWRPAATGGRWR